MTNEEIVRTCKWCLKEMETIERISKKMKAIVFEAMKSGNVDRMLDVAEMQITWTIIMGKKLKRVHEVRDRLQFEAEKLERAQRETSQERAQSFRFFYNSSSKVKN